MSLTRVSRFAQCLAIVLAWPVQADVVISQVYGGGGNTGAVYSHDFVELFNQGDSPQSLNGWSIQYASATATTWSSMIDLPNVTLEPGGYLLIQAAQGGGGGAPLPAPDIIDNTPINMASTSAKVALVNTTTLLEESCPGNAHGVLDLVGYGTANCFEGSGAVPALSNSTSAQRNGGGCSDTNDNAGDFTVAEAAPRNGNTATQPCGLAGIIFGDGFEGGVVLGSDYFAMAQSGGLDRIFIWKADHDADSCTRLTMVTAFGGPFDITAPAGWQAEGAVIEDGSQDCPPMTAGQTEAASHGTGTVAWPPLQPGEFFPCQLDIDVVLSFPIAGDVELKKDGIDVTGC